MNSRRVTLYYGRAGFVLLVSSAFFLLSVYAKTWTEHNIFPILFPAVAVSAWIGGKLGGLLSTMVLSVATAYFDLPPEGFAVGNPDDLIRLGTFTLSGTFVAWMSGALKDSQITLMSTLRSIGDAVIATDRRGAIRFLNRAAETLTGWSQSEAHGRPVADVFHAVEASTDNRVSIPSPSELREARSLPSDICLISKSGKRVFIDDSIAPIQVDSGNTVGSILVFRDGTRRRQYEADLVESERQRMQAQRMEAIGRLAGGIAHDFNNLLTVINGYADAASKQSVPPDRRQAAIAEIQKAGERAAKLTQKLLILSRGQPVKPVVTDLNEVIIGFEPLLRRLIGEDIELITNLSSEPLFVQIDVGQIEQVIMNLAANARDAMPNGGHLTLETATEILTGDSQSVASGESGVFAVLRIIDTGIGMDSQSKARLFEPFFTTKAIGKGTGLGLSIIYGIVKSHMGHVRVESEQDKGSVFEILLPRATASPERALQTDRTTELPKSTRTILLVEDNPDVRRLMQYLLSDLGYKVLEAGDPETAIAVVEGHKGTIDLLVTDVVMPGMGGIELARRLSKTIPEIKVLYVSGFANHAATAHVLSDREAHFLQKPFTPADLASAIANALLSR